MILLYNLNDHFRDPEGKPLTYTIASSKPGIGTASIVNNEKIELQRVQNYTGDVMITVTASDVHGETESISFYFQLQ